jgi:NAD-dependent protein deacetylase/lipoamidase
MNDLPPALLDCLRRARRVAVLTGASVSAESGIPTFRDALTGLWARYDPQELATPQAFQRNPQLVWEWYAYRRALVEAAAPNPAHSALAELERRIPDFTLITQNVDGLHQRAGSRNVVELHGNITQTRCFEENIPIKRWPTTDAVPPACPRCGGHLRPNVVWFGEALPVLAWAAASAATRRCEVFLCIGTSGVVQPAADLPCHASRRGAYVAEVNLMPSALDQLFDAHIYGPAGAILPMLIARL